MVNSLENIDKSKVYVDRIEGLDEVVGDWLYMNQNDKISVKGSNTISLKDNVELYALTNVDTNYPAIFYTDIDLDSLDLVDNTTIKLTLFIKTGIGGDFLTYLIAPFTYTNNAFYVNNPSSFEIPNDTFSITDDRFHFDGGGAIIYLTSIERNDQYDGTASMSSSQLLPTQYAVKTYIDANDNDLSSRINTKANDNTVVHLTGNQNIVGVKTFQSAIYNLVTLNDSRTGTFIARNMNYTLGTSPSSNKVSQIQFRDSTDDWTSLFQYGYQTDEQVSISMQCRKQDKSTSSTLAIGYKPDGSFFSYVPACDAANSIVTTVNKNKASNGYFQFGNGLIVQWGYVALTTATSGTVTYPKAFTNAASRAILNSNASGVVAYPSAESTTGFTWNKTSTNSAIKWIAIGY